MFISINQNLAEIKFNPKLNVFESDQYYLETETEIAVSEGYYLSPVPKTDDCKKCDYNEFVNKFKGSFVYVYYDKINKKLRVYNDLLSKKYVFYYYQDSCFACSTSYLDLIKYIKNNSLPLHIDDIGLKQMLTKGCFMDSTTYVEEIKFLRAFEYIEFNANLHVKTIAYPPIIRNASLDEACDEAYRLFSLAAQLQINKNEDNARKHIISLSGGMDSRAMFMQLKNQNISNISSYCYAQSNSVDQIVAQKIADDNHIEHIFYPLDNGMFITERDAIVDENEGQMTYCGATGMYECIKRVESTHSGLVHMGIGGGEILGDIIDQTMEVESKEYPKKAYQVNLNDIRCCQNSVLTASSRFEFASPFLYEDFFLYLMRLPFHIKHKRRLYVEIFNKYMYNSYETTAFRGVIGKRRSFVSKVFCYARELLLKRDRFSMNPFEYWWATNPSFKNYILNTFAADIASLKTYNLDIALLTKNFKGDVLAKMRTLTATAMLLRILGGKADE